VNTSGNVLMCRYFNTDVVTWAESGRWKPKAALLASLHNQVK
jgi:hypothetical protein